MSISSSETGIEADDAADDGLHLVAQVAAGARVDGQVGQRAGCCDRAPRHSAAMRSAALRGSGAAMIGRPDDQIARSRAQGFCSGHRPALVASFVAGPADAGRDDGEGRRRTRAGSARSPAVTRRRRRGRTTARAGQPLHGLIHRSGRRRSRRAFESLRLVSTVTAITSGGCADRCAASSSCGVDVPPASSPRRRRRGR